MIGVHIYTIYSKRTSIYYNFCTVQDYSKITVYPECFVQTHSFLQAKMKSYVRAEMSATVVKNAGNLCWQLKVLVNVSGYA